MTTQPTTGNPAAERLRWRIQTRLSRMEAEPFIADLDAALLHERRATVERVLLEAAHYNVLQGKATHARLRMICDAVLDATTSEEEARHG